MLKYVRQKRKDVQITFCYVCNDSRIWVIVICDDTPLSKKVFSDVINWTESLHTQSLGWNGFHFLGLLVQMFSHLFQVVLEVQCSWTMGGNRDRWPLCCRSSSALVDRARRSADNLMNAQCTFDGGQLFWKECAYSVYLVFLHVEELDFCERIECVIEGFCCGYVSTPGYL